MSKKVFPNINSITLSGEIVSAPVMRSTRGGPKLLTFIIGVSSGPSKPARIAVAAPLEMQAGLSEALKVGVEVLIEGQLIAAPVRSVRGLTPLRISATRIHALGTGGLSQEISPDAVDTGEQTVTKDASAPGEKPKRKTTRSRPVSVRKSRTASAISVRPAIRSSIKPAGQSAVKPPQAATVTSATSETSTASVASQHGRQRRRLKALTEDSQSLESTIQAGLAASSASASVKSRPLPKRPAKSKSKKTGARPRKTTSYRPKPAKAPAARRVPSGETAESNLSQTKPPKSSPKSRPARPTRPPAKRHDRSAKPAKPRSRPNSKAEETAKPGISSDSPFALTQSESSFDPFLVDDKD